MNITDAFDQHFQQYKAEISNELACTYKATDAKKDIIIVVHDQLPYLKACVESIRQNTTNYHLYIWDNASQPDTVEYLQNLMYAMPDQVDVLRSEENIGFVEPNNQLAKWGKGDYIILLNSDTKVFDGWDRGMVGFLENTPDVKQVGYLGGLLDANGMGGRAAFGYKIDYVCGWCSCLSRKTYDEYGLFDKGLKFAYCEDSDLSIRLQEAGHKIYSLHTLLVHHFENKTITAVHEEEKGGKRVNLYETFEHNHAYIRNKWHDYLTNKRVDTRG